MCTTAITSDEKSEDLTATLAHMREHAMNSKGCEWHHSGKMQAGNVATDMYSVAGE